MTPDEHDDQHDPLSPADEERISALLAEARAKKPMPADVVARLDQTLAGLTAERVAIDPVPADNVVPITRTRRHRVVAVLGAAAAVVVFGLAVGSFFDQSGDDDAGTAGVGADSDFERGSADDQGNAESLEDGFAEPDAHSPRDGGDVIVADRAYVVHSRHLSRDLARIQGLVLRDPKAAVYSQLLVHVPEGFACRTAAWGEGILVGVRYDGDPAFVAFRAPMGDAQVVDVLQCGTGDLLRTTTLPTR